MADTQNQPEPIIYHIRLQGHLDSGWGDWFGGVTVTFNDDGTTLLIGEAIDQAALHGLLKKVRDLGLPLISVNRVNPGTGDTPTVES
ncbi:MAG: hypothetical protein CL610_06560 [Anaerolineaceae bacterium]|nr:hypothetical protein [Anaerolineaceae bacterium]